MLSSLEDVLTRDPSAKHLALIAHFWGGEVGDYFRSSTQSKTPLGVVVGAARVFPDYTIARRLVNENILIRLENETANYRRKRYATAMDWYGIKRMTPIANPIDPLRLRALGLHLGEFHVLEEGLASDNN